jgi:integrase/recombinase XerD
MREWGPDFQSQSQSSTYSRYLCSLEQIGSHLEGRRLSEINAQLVGEIVRERQKAGVLPATIKRDLGALSSVMNFAIVNGWCEANPVLPRMKLIKEERDPIVLPRDEDIELMISRAPGMWPQLVRAAWATGAREDELIKATRGATSTASARS